MYHYLSGCYPPQSRTDSSKIINDQSIGLSQIIMSNFQSNQEVKVARHPLPPPMALKTQVVPHPLQDWEVEVCICCSLTLSCSKR